MEHKNGGLEDDFPFQLSDVYRFHLNFRGCKWLVRSLKLTVLAPEKKKTKGPKRKLVCVTPYSQTSGASVDGSPWASPVNGGQCKDDR